MSGKVIEFVNEPLVPVTVKLTVPVGVPVTTLKSVGADEPPPGVGLLTTTGKLPVLARSLAVKPIENCVAVGASTECAMPLYVTVEELLNPEPVTTNV